ncbi:nicotinamide mononucleotide transporter [Parapedobacter sp. SGR-10]|uniref:nicotinamide riboside transporter PnuC n=1 Tax=Parapedobacter sp. SGR-10 TaxID=2710879 RepID=UPI0013D305B2|nr:nicotinamide riboside transporter PnuC [Parapedobacter sp. SGR-10]NGF58053.1 nicotinamide mononucleotide transporter [Parapedobacter sp. SGR-10]
MEIIETLTAAFQQTSWLERFSVLCGIIQVLLSKNNKVSNYFFGIMGILSGMYVLFGAKLYAEIALNMYYLIMSIYGWWYWVNNRTAAQQPITSCSRKEWRVVAGISLVGFVFLYLVLEHVTDSDVPAWDAWVSSTAWAGMWLLAKRKIENWILLNISNAFAVPLLIHKDLYLFAALTTFLFIVAIFGFIKWRKLMTIQNLKTA